MERGPNEKTEVQADVTIPVEGQTKDSPDGQADDKVIKKARIVGIKEVPDWLVDNVYLVSGYRVDFERKRDIFRSLFMKHNELLNIWTHLIGGLIFFVILIYVCFNLDYYLMATKRLVFNEAAMEKIHDILVQQHKYYKLESASLLDDVIYEAEHFDFAKHFTEMQHCVKNYSSDFLRHCRDNVLALRQIAGGDREIFGVTLAPILEMVDSCVDIDRPA